MVYEKIWTIFKKKITVTQKDPENLYEKLSSYICYVSQNKKFNLSNMNVYAINEAALWFGMI